MRSRRTLDAALRAYVEGRDRVWELDRKLGGPLSDEPDPEIEFGGAPAPPRYGVPVPESLDFRRGPARWRDGDGRPETPGDA